MGRGQDPADAAGKRILGPKQHVEGDVGRRFARTARPTRCKGNRQKLRDTLTQLSASAGSWPGSGNLVDVIKNLEVFVTVPKDSNVQIVQFENCLASVTSVVDGGRSDLDGALTNLSSAVVDVQRFHRRNTRSGFESVQRLGVVVKISSDDQMALKNVLHVTPNALGNAYNIYNRTQAAVSAPSRWGTSRIRCRWCVPAIGALNNATSAETGKLCAQYLGPALRLLNFNYLPFLATSTGQVAEPENLIYPIRS